MMRIVPKDEATFRERCRDVVFNFMRDEGLNWHTASNNKIVDDAMWTIAAELWYIKQNVKPEETDLMNTKENRLKWEKDIEKAKRLGKMTYSCACGLTTNIEKDFDAHDCKFRKLQRRSIKKL